MNIFFGKTKVEKALKEIEKIDFNKSMDTQHLRKIQEWLISLNTRIKNRQLSGKEKGIKELEILLREIEKKEADEKAIIQKIENTMNQISMKKAA
ncbi:MAG: hypothetical protein KAK00_10335 [Nanoarchaeota archaeon]|nr:hypothetical protein [Nanoarchaeota archaeon]